MAQACPDLPRVAARVERAMEDDSAPAREKSGGWGSLLRSAAEAAAEHYADVTASNLDGTKRFSPVRPGKCVVHHHACADDQICIEFRMNKGDARKSRVRAAVLEGLEEHMVDSAFED